jgi:hypothetical protein
MSKSYDPAYIEPLPWIIGGSNGRGITTPTGYVGDGLIADFDTKAHAEFALKRINEYDSLLAAANEVLRTYMPQFPDSRAVDDCLVNLAAVICKPFGGSTDSGGEKP